MSTSEAISRPARRAFPASRFAAQASTSSRLRASIPAECRMSLIGVDRLAPAPASVVEIAVAQSSQSKAPADDEVISQGGRHEALLAWARSRLTAKGILG